MNANNLNAGTVSQVVKEYEWPVEVVIKDEFPDGVAVNFPDCGLFVCDGNDGGVLVYFSGEDTGCDLSLHLGHAMSIIDGGVENSKNAGVVQAKANDRRTSGKELVEISLRYAFLLLNTRLLHVILGDFSWVDAYIETQNARKNQ